VPKGLSLHIGLNSVDPAHYEGWSGPLTACEADAEDMQAVAAGVGYAPTLLKTAAATRRTVIDDIKAAAKQMNKGDIFFLSYSGHGGQLPDRNSDEPDDLMDETWCLFDGELIDDELYELWRLFPAGSRVLVLSDSCHSGTAIRMALSQPGSGPARAALRAYGLDGDGEVRYRVMPPDVALRTYRAHAAFYDGLQPRKARRAKGKKKPKAPVQASVRLISGCQDNQLSADGTFNGLFTGMLLRVWNKGGFKGDYAGFHKSIVKRMPPAQTPNHFSVGVASSAYDGQKPLTI
jgi:hypothetical protein